jgi:hypothetical protein
VVISAPTLPIERRISNLISRFTCQKICELPQ